MFVQKKSNTTIGGIKQQNHQQQQYVIANDSVGCHIFEEHMLVTQKKQVHKK
jgi:hypothetical protein